MNVPCRNNFMERREYLGSYDYALINHSPYSENIWNYLVLWGKFIKVVVRQSLVWSLHTIHIAWNSQCFYWVEKMPMTTSKSQIFDRFKLVNSSKWFPYVEERNQSEVLEYGIWHLQVPLFFENSAWDKLKIVRSLDD